MWFAFLAAMKIFGEIFAIFSSIFGISDENLCGFSRELEEELRDLFGHWYLASKSVNEWMHELTSNDDGDNRPSAKRLRSALDT